MVCKLALFVLLLFAFNAKAQDVSVFSDTAEIDKSYFIYSLNEQQDTVCIDSLTLLGTMHIENKGYKVISIFRRIKMATSWRENTRLKFYAKDKEHIYYLGNKDCLPKSIADNELVFKEESVEVDQLREMICLPCGCH